MGLDNMPHEYPCKRQGTAVIDKQTHTWTDDEGKVHSEDSYPIDCDKTITAGGCPFTNADPPKDGRILGMLGTYCWYRGKSGNGLIQALNGGDVDDVWGIDDANSFYGTDNEGLYRPPTDCVDLADDMAGKLEAMGGKLICRSEDYTAEALYAIWYLRWVAKDCDGMDAWY
jgi:hypothetical protein